MHVVNYKGLDTFVLSYHVPMTSWITRVDWVCSWLATDGCQLCTPGWTTKVTTKVKEGYPSQKIATETTPQFKNIIAVFLTFQNCTITRVKLIVVERTSPSSGSQNLVKWGRSSGSGLRDLHCRPLRSSPSPPFVILLFHLKLQHGWPNGTDR